MIILDQKNMVGTILFVYPIYGWGWTVFNETVELPNNFHIEITAITKRYLRVNGIRGKIVANNHVYNDYYIEANIRHTGIYNFSNKIGDYNILISNEPIKKSNPHKQNKHRIVYGYGFIGIEQYVIDFTNKLFKIK